MNTIKPQGFRKKEQSIKAGAPNGVLLFIITALIIFGAIMIFDASVYVASQAPFNDQFYFLKQHLVWLLVGSILAFLVYNWDYRKIAKVSLLAVFANVALLIAVLFLAEKINGSRRWFTVGPIPIQPGEFAKPLLIIYVSAWLAENRDKIPTIKNILEKKVDTSALIFIGLVALNFVLVLLEPDLGTTMVLAGAVFAIFWASGTKIKHLTQMLKLGVGMVIAAAGAAIAAPYRFDRVQTYLKLLTTGEIEDPSGTGYQIYQILIGIGSAGWLGVGFGQSRQRFGYLVENTAHTDSIFAVFLEELGLPGAILLIVTWILFLSTSIYVANRAPDRTGKLMAIGIGFWLTVQALLNMSANVGLIPLTGLPLPFFTYGGSNTIVTLVGAALLLNISRFSSNNGARKTA